MRSLRQVRVLRTGDLCEYMLCKCKVVEKLLFHSENCRNNVLLYMRSEIMDVHDFSIGYI